MVIYIGSVWIQVVIGESVKVWHQCIQTGVLIVRATILPRVKNFSKDMSVNRC